MTSHPILQDSITKQTLVNPNVLQRQRQKRCAGKALALGIFTGALALSGSFSAQAATRTWTGDLSNLWNTIGNWDTAVPGAIDIARWDAVSDQNLGITLESAVSVLGLEILNPAGPVALSGAGLTIGFEGIDMSAATQNLTINSPLTLGSGHQVWDVLSGRTLTLATGTLTRSLGATLNIQGTGTVAAASSGLVNDASSGGGIIGPWATVGAGTDTRYATLSGGNIVAYTGATVQSDTTAWGGIPSGGTGTVNYDITTGGTKSVTGLGRDVNTVRYTGTTNFVQQSNTSAVLLTTNGILNSGTGSFTVGTGGNSLNVGIGSRNELVLHAASAGIVIDDVISGAAGARVTVVGPNTVTMNGTNTYTGGTFINSGRLIANAASLNAGPVVIAEEGAVTFTTGTSSSAISGSGDILNNTAGTVVFTGDHSGFTGSFTQNGANNTQFNSALSGSASAAYNLTMGEIIFALSGNYTVQMGSFSSATGTTIRGGNTATGTTTLQVGDLDTSGSISGNLNNGATKIVALNKVGDGTLTIANTAGTNTYSGGTLVTAGTLATDPSGGNLGIGNVTLADNVGVTLTLGNASSFGDSAILTFGLANTVINMSFIGEELLGGITNGTISLAPDSYTAAELNQIFGGNNFVDTGAIVGDATLTVIPEPGAVVSLLGGVAMLGMRRRRRA